MQVPGRDRWTGPGSPGGKSSGEQLGRASVKKVEGKIPKKTAARMPQCQGCVPESFCLLGQEEAQCFFLREDDDMHLVIH